jgi:hypothetical protein
VAGLLAAPALLAGCRSSPSRDVRPEFALLRASPGAWMVRTELFFGHARPDGTVITEHEWDQFVADEISPRFPAGFTIVEARGQWRDAVERVIHESTRVVIVVHAPDNLEASTRIEQIRESFKQRFSQEAVLRADSPARVSF